MIFTLMLSFFGLNFAVAAPLFGYATPEPQNKYQIFNFKGQKIYSATTDAVRRVELRDGFAIVQGLANNVSLIREDGTTIIENLFGSEILISNRLLAVFNKNGNGFVYTVDGKKLYPSSSEANRPVKEIKIANQRFVVVDQFNDSHRIFNDDGKEVAVYRGIKKFRVTDGFVSLTTVLDNEMLFGESMDDLLTTEPVMKQLQITDEFAAYFDFYDNFRLFTRQAGEYVPQNNVNSFELTNHFAILKTPIGISVLGKKLEEMDFLNNQTQSVVTSHAIMAYRSNTGIVYVKNQATGDLMSVNVADSFQVSDDLLMTRNGNTEIRVFSLKAGQFGKLLYSTMNPLLLQTQIGNGLVSMQTRYFNSQFSETTIVGFELKKAGITLVDDLWANKVNLSVNREEWNWQ